MRHILRSLLLSSVLFSRLTPLGVAQTNSSPAAMSSVVPKTGEIMLEGTIAKIDIPWRSDTATLTLKTSAFATPGKEIKPLPAAKDKAITFSYSKANLQFSEGAPQALHKIPNATDVLVAGQKIRVIGPDGGTGSTLNATLLITDWKGDGYVIEGTTKPNPPQYGHGMKGDFGQSGTRSVTFSGDGKLMATAADWPEKSVKIWDMEAGRVLHSFDNHWKGQWLISWMRFAPDGKTLIAQATSKSEDDPDSFLFVWNTAAEKYFVVRYGETADGIKLSPDGKMIALGDGGKFIDNGNVKGVSRIRLFRVVDGKLIREMTDPDAIDFDAIEFSPDGKLLYSLGSSQKQELNDTENLRIWDVESGKKVRSIAFAVSDSLERISGTKNIRIFHDGYEDWIINEAGAEKVNGFKIPSLVKDFRSFPSPSGELICFRVAEENYPGGKAHLVFLKVSDGSVVKTPTYEGIGSFTYGSFTPDEKFFAVPEIGNGVTLFDVATGKQARTITLPMKPEN